MIRHHKVVAALPDPLVEDSIYYVRVGSGVDIYVTNSTGIVVSYKPNYQAANLNLEALAGLTGAADRLPYFSGIGALSLATLTAFGRSLMALADDPAARTLLKLSATDQVTFAGLLFNAFTKIYPESNGIKIQLGSTTAATGYITIKSTGEMVLESAGLTVGGSLLPKTTTILLGNPTFPWSIGYIKTLTMSGAINFAPRVTLDSATTPGTVDLGAAAVISNSVLINGTNNVASFGFAAPVGAVRTVRFGGVLILVNSATLLLPGGANITTAAGDCGVFECLAAGSWRCVSWQRADGQSPITFGGGTLTKALNNAPQVTIASAGAIDVAGALANTIRITGTQYIGSLGNAPSGSKRTLIFDGAATLAFSTVMILPGGANITATVGDIAEFECEGLGAWRCTSYTRASGLPVVSSRAALVRNTAATPIPHNTLTWMTFNTEVFDSGGIANLGTDSTYLTVPENGLYMVYFAADLAAVTGATSGTVANLRVAYDTGSLVLIVAGVWSISGRASQLSASGLSYLTAGSKLRAGVFQDSGQPSSARGTGDYSSYFGIAKVG